MAKEHFIGTSGTQEDAKSLSCWQVLTVYGRIAQQLFRSGENWFLVKAEVKGTIITPAGVWPGQ